MPGYDPQFVQKCPAFLQLEPELRRHLSSLQSWPSVSEYNTWSSRVAGAESMRLPRFEEQTPAAVKAAGGYEHFIAQHQVVPTRAGNWHDLFNALIWLHYPRYKWAANALQIAETGSPRVDPRNKRTLVQSRAAQFDEGAVVLLVDDLCRIAPLERLGWREFFVDQRALFEQQIACIIVGHALFESLLQPFVGITAKAIAMVVPAGDALNGAPPRQAIDQYLVQHLPTALSANTFYPLPVLGMPGWHPDQSEAFYADPRYFRLARQSGGGRVKRVKTDAPVTC